MTVNAMSSFCPSRIVPVVVGASLVSYVTWLWFRARSQPSTTSAEDAPISGTPDNSQTPRSKRSTSDIGPLIIGVTGASGSGKTSISTLLASHMGPSANVVAISSDSYYKSMPHGMNPMDYNFDHPSSIDFELLSEHVAALRRGEEVEIPQYDFLTHQRIPGQTTRVSGRDSSVIIIDGIFVLWSREVASQCDMTIFCVEDPDVCLARRLRRDLQERGRTVESVLTQYLRHVREGYLQFVAPMMTSADIIIPRARENTVAIEMLVRDLKRLRPRETTTQAAPMSTTSCLRSE